MLKFSGLAAAFASASLLLAPALAHAADGHVCFGPLLTTTSKSTIPSTTTYPQISDSTTFACGLGTAYTIRQLSQLGWIIVSVQPAAYSTSLNSDGSATTKERVMLVIQK